RPSRGLMLRVEAGPEGAGLGSGSTPARLSSAPLADGPPGDELLGHALAVLDARWVVLSSTVVAGQEERIRRFARVLRRLPAPAESGPAIKRLSNGLAARSWSVGSRTYLELANDTPYKVRLETVVHGPSTATIDDLGRGLVLMPVAAAGG